MNVGNVLDCWSEWHKEESYATFLFDYGSDAATEAHQKSRSALALPRYENAFTLLSAALVAPQGIVRPSATVVSTSPSTEGGDLLTLQVHSLCCGQSTLLRTEEVSILRRLTTGFSLATLAEAEHYWERVQSKGATPSDSLSIVFQEYVTIAGLLARLHPHRHSDFSTVQGDTSVPLCGGTSHHLQTVLFPNSLCFTDSLLVRQCCAALEVTRPEATPSPSSSPSSTSVALPYLILVEDLLVAAGNTLEVLYNGGERGKESRKPYPLVVSNDEEEEEEAYQPRNEESIGYSNFYKEAPAPKLSFFASNQDDRLLKVLFSSTTTGRSEDSEDGVPPPLLPIPLDTFVHHISFNVSLLFHLFGYQMTSLMGNRDDYCSGEENEADNRWRVNLLEQRLSRVTECKYCHGKPLVLLQRHYPPKEKPTTTEGDALVAPSPDSSGADGNHRQQGREEEETRADLASTWMTEVLPSLPDSSASSNGSRTPREEKVEAERTELDSGDVVSEVGQHPEEEVEEREETVERVPYSTHYEVQFPPSQHKAGCPWRQLFLNPCLGVSPQGESGESSGGTPYHNKPVELTFRIEDPPNEEDANDEYMDAEEEQTEGENENQIEDEEWYQLRELEREMQEEEPSDKSDEDDRADDNNDPPTPPGTLQDSTLEEGQEEEEEGGQEALSPSDTVTFSFPLTVLMTLYKCWKVSVEVQKQRQRPLENPESRIMFLYTTLEVPTSQDGKENPFAEGLNPFDHSHSPKKNTLEAAVESTLEEIQRQCLDGGEATPTWYPAPVYRVPSQTSLERILQLQKDILYMKAQLDSLSESDPSLNPLQSSFSSSLSPSDALNSSKNLRWFEQDSPELDSKREEVVKDMENAVQFGWSLLQTESTTPGGAANKEKSTLLQVQAFHQLHRKAAESEAKWTETRLREKKEASLKRQRVEETLHQTLLPFLASHWYPAPEDDTEGNEKGEVSPQSKGAVVEGSLSNDPHRTKPLQPSEREELYRFIQQQLRYNKEEYIKARESVLPRLGSESLSSTEARKKKADPSAVAATPPVTSAPHHHHPPPQHLPPPHQGGTTGEGGVLTPIKNTPGSLNRDNNDSKESGNNFYASHPAATTTHSLQARHHLPSTPRAQERVEESSYHYFYPKSQSIPLAIPLNDKDDITAPYDYSQQRTPSQSSRATTSTTHTDPSPILSTLQRREARFGNPSSAPAGGVLPSQAVLGSSGGSSVFTSGSVHPSSNPRGGNDSGILGGRGRGGGGRGGGGILGGSSSHNNSMPNANSNNHIHSINPPSGIGRGGNARRTSPNRIGGGGWGRGRRGGRR